MSYTKLDPQPAQRAADAVGVAAPGLYPNEVAVKLDDTGQLVAVYVESVWKDNNAGVAYYSSARAINADGSTMLCPAGQQVVTEPQFLADPLEVQEFGNDALAKEMVLVALGEPATMVTETAADGTQTQVPIVPWTDLVRAQFSIRHALALVSTAGAVTDLGSII